MKQFLTNLKGDDIKYKKFYKNSDYMEWLKGKEFVYLEVFKINQSFIEIYYISNNILYNRRESL